MELIDEPRRAERLARAIVSDVLSYHRDRVRAGIEADDLFERLAKEIHTAHTFFADRVTPELLHRSGAFERALVDVLVYRSREVPSRIW